jgi:hypothetical protein
VSVKASKPIWKAPDCLKHKTPKFGLARQLLFRLLTLTLLRLLRLLSMNETKSKLRSKRRKKVLLQELTLEEVSLTFQVLMDQLPVESLPEHLQTLDQEQWGLLGHLLGNLKCEQMRSSLH